MSDFTQDVSSVNFPPDDSMKNYSVTDIPAGTAVLFDTASGHFNGVVVPTTAGAKYPVCGITMETIAAGKFGRVRRRGMASAVASGAITAGDFVGIDSASTHEGQVITAAAHQQALGQAMVTAADGDKVKIEILPSSYTT